MRALLAVVPVLLLSGLAAGCFDLKGDDQSFCQGLHCGVFVSSSLGSDTVGDGTRDRPFASLSKGVRAAQAALGVPVYACGEVFEESLSITGDTVVFGAYDCAAGWVHKPEAPTTLTAASGKIPLSVAGGVGLGAHDLIVRAPDGTSPGDSSIAVVAGEGAKLEMLRCSIEAGDGASAGDAVAESIPAPDGLPGTDGGEACSAKDIPGAVGPQSACVGASKGGAGARGDATDPENGTAAGSGAPTPKDTSNAGTSETDNAVCTAGQTGIDGSDGAGGAAAKSLGKLDLAKGLIGAAGAAGKPGTPGQGGGGGGGARGGAGTGKCASADAHAGASGGSGGSGGCGGLGGGAGAAGGASIGIVSLGAQFTFTDVRLKVGSGGNGGGGAVGQAGGAGAPGGKGGTVPADATDLHPACDGGPGGAGGKGGAGGGGRGGHSIGIAYLKEAPSTTGLTITIGTPGEGGKGPGPAQADPGVAAQTQAF